MANDSERVVVTGMGAVSPWGWGAKPLWQGLRSGLTRVRSFARFDNRRHRTHLAGEVPDVGPAPSCGTRASLADRFALSAAREAVEQAGLDRRCLGPSAGVYFGTSTAGMRESEVFFEALLARREPSRRLLASQQLNGPGDAVARYLRVGGPVESLSSACASGALAIEAALRAVRCGRVDVAVAGASDSLCLITYSGFNALRAVDEAACRPFRAGRAGMSLGEGAAVLVVEREATARRRGVRPLAELVGAGSACDARHMTAPDPEGRGAALAIERALSDAALGPESIGFVNAHGTGTPLNDAAEWAALVRVFGIGAARELPVTATKACVGHLLGAAGAIEAVATIQCLMAGEVHPTPGSGPIDPALPVRLVLGAPLSVDGARFALSTSLAFGGANAALILGRWAG
jgi:3-oxoacyl-[acyl-carrier-protein] synthase II